MKAKSNILMWLSIMTLTLFQPLTVTAQDFSIQLTSGPTPGLGSPNSVFYDEAGQFVYFTGLAEGIIDGQPYKGGVWDILVTKNYMNGTRAWTRIVGGTANEQGMKIIQNPATLDVFVFSYSDSAAIDKSPSNGNHDSAIVKFAANGTRLFTKLFGYGNTDTANDAFLDIPTQQLIVVGTVGAYFGISRNDLNNGSVLRSFLVGTNAWANSVTPIGTGPDCFVAGDSAVSLDGQPFSGSHKMMLIKWNYRNGSTYWIRQWGNKLAEAQDVAFDPNSQLVFVTGYNTDGTLNSVPSVGGIDAVLMCTHANGTLLWTRQFGTTTDDNGYSVEIHRPSGIVIVAGYFSGTYPSKSFAGQAGFVATFKQNGDMQQMSFQASLSKYKDISFGSSYSMAFIADNNGAFVSFVNNAQPVVYVSQVPVSTASLPKSTIISVYSTDVPVTVSTYSASVVAKTMTTPAASNPVLALTTKTLDTSDLGAASTTMSPAASTVAITITTPATSNMVTAMTPDTSVVAITTITTPDVTPDETAYTSSTSAYISSDHGKSSFIEMLQSPSLVYGLAILGVVFMIILTVIGVLRCFKMFPFESQKVLIDKVHDTSASFSSKSDYTKSHGQQNSYSNSNLRSAIYGNESYVSNSTAMENTSSTLMERDSFELSLPGFLLFPMGQSFVLSKQIARGGGGIVYIGQALTLNLSAYGKRIIIKTFGKQETGLLRLSKKQQKSFKQEVSLMYYFRDCKYIAKVLGWCDDPAAILMKFYPRGALDSWIYSPLEKTKTLQLRFMQDIANGIQAIHEAGFVHCDLKPQNVLVDSDQNNQLFCVLTDFGIAQVVDNSSLLVRDFVVVNIRGISTKYSAPEALDRLRSKAAPEKLAANIVCKLDLYSYSMIILELLTRMHPWTFFD